MKTMTIPGVPISLDLDMIDEENYRDALIADSKIIATKGGKGSGNFGHTGRPGKVGGSVTSSPEIRALMKRVAGHRLELENKRKEQVDKWISDLWSEDTIDKAGVVFQNTSLIQDFPEYEVTQSYVIDPDFNIWSCDEALHTRIFSKMTLSGVGAPDEKSLDKAYEVMRYNAEENEFLEYSYLEKGYVSIGKSWGDVTYIKMSGKLDKHTINRVSRLIKKDVLRLGINQPFTVICFNKDKGYLDSESATIRTDIDLVDGFIKEGNRWKVVTKQKTKGGKGSGNFNHAGRIGKVGGSAPRQSGSDIALTGKDSFSVRYVDQYGAQRIYNFKKFSNYDEMVNDSSNYDGESIGGVGANSFFVLPDNSLLRVPYDAEHTEVILSLLESGNGKAIGVTENAQKISETIRKKGEVTGFLPFIIPGEAQSVMRVRTDGDVKYGGHMSISTDKVDRFWLRRIQKAMDDGALPLYGKSGRGYQINWSSYEDWGTKDELSTTSLDIINAKGIINTEGDNIPPELKQKDTARKLIEAIKDRMK